MIPESQKDGFLPPGIHLTTLVEFENRFSYSIWRKDFFKHLMQLVQDLRSIGCTAIYIDGSFISNKRIPGDMDICWEDKGLDHDIVKAEMPILFDFANGRKNQQNKYKADIFPAHLIEGSSGTYFIDFFQKVKYTNEPKGIIKIII